MEISKHISESLDYRSKDIVEGLKVLVNGNLEEEKAKYLKEDLVKQLEELKAIVKDL